MITLKKIVRTAQVRFPQLREFRHSADRIYRRLKRQPHDPDFAVLAGRRFDPSAVLVDIGANRGQSIDLNATYQPHQPIIAFEPNELLSQRLQRMFAHDGNVTIRTVGLGSTEGRFQLHVPTYNGWEFDGQGALDFKTENFGYVRESIIGFDESKFKLRKLACWVCRLDSFGLKPCFIKIDTEWSELDVVRGALETLREHRPILMIENSGPDEMNELLKPLGYSAFHYHEGLKPGVVATRNTIYARELPSLSVHSGASGSHSRESENT